MKLIFKFSLIAIVVLGITGCGSKAQPSPTPTPTTTVTPATLVCSSSQLAVVLGSESAAMGARGVSGMGFRNVSATPCTLFGYPKVQMTGTNGKLIKTINTRVSTIMGMPTSISIVNLQPGSTAHFNLLYESSTGYGNAICPTSTQVEFTPPGSGVPLVLPWKIQPYGGSTIQTLQCGEIKVSPIYFP